MAINPLQGQWNSELQEEEEAVLLPAFCGQPLPQPRQHLFLLNAEIGTKQQWLLANYACPTGLFTIQQMEDIKQHFA